MKQIHPRIRPTGEARQYWLRSVWFAVWRLRDVERQGAEELTGAVSGQGSVTGSVQTGGVARSDASAVSGKAGATLWARPYARGGLRMLRDISPAQSASAA